MTEARTQPGRKTEAFIAKGKPFVYPSTRHNISLDGNSHKATHIATSIRPNKQVKGLDDNFSANILGSDGKLPNQTGPELGQSLGLEWESFPKISYKQIFINNQW